MVDLGLCGTRAIVAGAGDIPTRAGIGRRTAVRLAEAGAIVACLDMSEERAAATADVINASGGKAFPIVADVTDSKDVERAIDEAVRKMGGVDVCVDIIGKNNGWAEGHLYSDEEWDRSIAINLNQVFYLFRGVTKRMIAQATGGALIAVTSVDGTTSSVYHASYGAAKAGVISMVRSFAQELGRYGIRVNSVAPGNVGAGNDDQPEGEFDVNGINPLAAPRTQDIANALLFLSSDLAARITGQTIVVDGGASVKSPWPLDPAVLPRDIP